MARTTGLHNYSDVHYTDRKLAKYIVDYFQPEGKVLEPFKGEGAFFDELPPDSLWCEIEQGRCFFDFKKKVDWIITNPPYSNLTDVMSHAFDISTNTVLLVPMSKIYSSPPRMRMVQNLAGIKEQHVFGSGRSIGFDLGFPFAAMHFVKGYTGPTKNSWFDSF